MATYTGNSTRATPIIRIRWANILPQGRFSTIASSLVMTASVVYAPFDEAELHYGQCNHDHHQDHGLSGGAAQVEPYEAVGVDFVDQRVGRLGGATLGGGVNHTESVEHGVDHIDH